MRSLLMMLVCGVSLAAWAGAPPPAPTRLWITGGVAGRQYQQELVAQPPVNLTGFSPTTLHLSGAHFFNRFGVDVEGRGELFFAKQTVPATGLSVPLPAFDLSAAAAVRFVPLSWLTFEGQVGWAVGERSVITQDGALGTAHLFFTGPSLGLVAGLAPTRAVSGQLYVRAVPVVFGLGTPTNFRLLSLSVGAQASLGALHLGDAQLGVAVSVEYAATGMVTNASWANQNALRLGVGLSVQQWMEEPPPPKPALPSLKGRVLSSTDQPVEGAVVVLDDTERTRSDASGAFTFAGVARGKHRVSASKEGASPVSLEVTTPSSAVVLTLGAPTGPGRVAGVVRAGATVLAGAEVLAVETQQRAKSGADGTYLLPRVGPGPVTVQVKAEGFTSAEEVVQVAPGGEAAVDFTLTPSTVAVRATLRGLIRDTSGEPVKATVRVVELKLKLQVKADGRFTADVPSGKYTLVIEARGFVAQTKTVEVSGGDQAIFHAVLERVR